MTSHPYTEHEKYANQADDYLDQHNVYELFGSLLRNLVLHKPKDPLSFMIDALEQPVQQLRVLVVSPPEPRVASLLSSLVRELGILRLRLSTIVGEEVAAASPLGKQARSYVENEQELPEQIALPLLAARANKPDALASGWLLEGYPNTRAQALAMQAAGILPTHVLYFTNGASSSPSADAITVASAEQYRRHGAAVQEVFAPVAHFVDLAQTNETLLAQLTTLLNVSPRSHAPKRPMRVVLLGPRGAGRQTQASLLAQKYGLVHVNASALLRAEIERLPSLREQVCPFMESGILVRDDIVAPLVVARLLAADAKSRGFVLDGFPRTRGQAAALAKASIVPNRVVLLDVPLEECRARISGRRRDPDTGDEYNFRTQAEEAALPSVIRDRLVQSPHDSECTLEANHFAHTSFIDEVREVYSGVVREIGGTAGARAIDTPDQLERAKQNVFEQIEDFLLAPLNNQYAHTKAKAQAAAAAQ